MAHSNRLSNPPPARRRGSPNTPGPANQAPEGPDLGSDGVSGAPKRPGGHQIRGSLVTYDLEGASGWHTWAEPTGDPPEPVPVEHIPGWLADALTPERLRAIRRERWLTREAIDGYVGWDRIREAWVLLVRDEAGSIVNITHRPPRGRWCYMNGGTYTRKPTRLRGRTAANGGLPLWPRVPAGDTWLLAAGEWDALAALQAGIPAVTGLLGCQWHAAWDRHVRGRRIAVAYDVGELDAARVTVDKLLAAGAADAWAADLGLPVSGDDVERALRPVRYGGYGWDADRFREICKLERED
jgi:hypothetical protein